MLERERDRVAAAGRRLAGEGLVTGTAGNVSERREDLIAITATGSALGQLNSEDVVVVDLDGRPVAGGLDPSSELLVHLGIYARYQPAAIVHTHSPQATALSRILEEVPLVDDSVLQLGGPVRVAPYAPSASAELAALTVDALENRQAALMASHGTVCLGNDLEQAVDRATRLERACRRYAAKREAVSP
jgi:L-fuculose-phosphate aldolase